MQSIVFIVSNESHDLQKQILMKKTWKRYWITCCTHMTSHGSWEDETVGVMISIKKDQWKLKHFEKNVF